MFPSRINLVLARLGRIIGVITLCVGLGACSAIKLGYNNLPELSYWWLDSYIDLTDAQAPRVREDLARLHQWHRNAELPRYVALLRRAEQMAGADLTAAQACELVDEGRLRLAAITEQAEAPLTTAALTLTPEQLRHLAQRHERNNRDFRKEWIDVPLAARQEKRFKQIAERMEMLYGDLEEPQRKLLRQQVEASSFDPAQALAERQRRQAGLMALLRQLQAPGLPLQQARMLMRSHLQGIVNPPEGSPRQTLERLQQQGCANTAAVHNSASPAQRQRAAQRLRGWQRDLTELSQPL